MYNLRLILKNFAKNFFSWGFFTIACGVVFCTIFFPSIFAQEGEGDTGKSYTITFKSGGNESGGNESGGDESDNTKIDYLERVKIFKVVTSSSGTSEEEIKKTEEGTIKDTIAEGNSVTYVIKPKEGYAFKKEKTTVTDNNNTKLVTEENFTEQEIKFTLTNITGDTTVEISNVLQKFNITFANGSDRKDLENVNIYKIVSSSSETSSGTESGTSEEEQIEATTDGKIKDTVIEGDSVTYVMKLTDSGKYAFVKDKTTIKIGDSTTPYTWDYVTEKDIKNTSKITFTLESIKDNTTVKISNVLQKFNITFANGSDKKDLENVNIYKIVSSSSETSSGTDSGTSEEEQIEATTDGKIKDTVIEDDSVTYVIKPKEGYVFRKKTSDANSSEKATTFKIDDNVIEDTSDDNSNNDSSSDDKNEAISIEENEIKLTFKEVKKDRTVKISNVLQKFNITFKSGDAEVDHLDRVNIYKSDDLENALNTEDVKDEATGDKYIIVKDTVIEGDSVTYVIKPRAGYTFSKGTANGEGKTTVTDNNSLVTAGNFAENEIKFTLENVTSDKTVKISNVLFKKYKVKFEYKTEDTNIINEKPGILNIMDIYVGESTSRLSTNESEITYEETQTYTFNLQEGYTQSVLSVSVGEKKLEIQNNKCTLSKVTEDTTITISGVKKNMYTIRITNNATEAIEIETPSTEKLKELEELGAVHGSDLTLTLKTKLGYNFSGENNLIDISDTLNTISGDEKTVTISGDKKTAKINVSDIWSDLTITIKKDGYTEDSKNLVFTNNNFTDDSEKNFFKEHFKAYFASKEANGTYTKEEKSVQTINPYKDQYLLLEFDKNYFKFNEGFNVTPSCGEIDLVDDVYTINNQDKTKEYKLVQYGKCDDTINNNDPITFTISGLSIKKYSVTFQAIDMSKNMIDELSSVLNISIISDKGVETLNKVEYGDIFYDSSLEFLIEPINSDKYTMYSESAILVTDSGGRSVQYSIVDEDAENHIVKNCRIKIPNVYDNLKITFSLDKNGIMVNFTKIDGIKYYDCQYKDEAWSIIQDAEIHDLNKYTDDQKVKFAVVANTGYDLGSLDIKFSGYVDDDKQIKKVFENSDFVVYEFIADVSNTISGSISKYKYSVTLETKLKDSDGNDLNDTDALGTYLQDGIKITGISEVIYGNSTHFEVELPQKYNQSQLKVYVYDVPSNDSNETEVKNLQEIPLYDGKYVIYDITSNKCVYIKNISINKYMVNLMESNGIKYKINNNVVNKQVNSVKYDDEFRFSVKAEEGYFLNDSLVVNCVSVSSSKALESISGSEKEREYVIKNIKENYTVNVSSVENVKYTITLEETNGVTYLNDTGSTISGEIKVGHGDDFEFSVSVDDAYDDSAAGMYIIVNDGKHTGANKLASGRYIISNITEDIKIKVGNIRKNTYEVSLVKTEGMDYYNLSNKIINGDNKVEHNDSLTFKVVLYPAYEDSKYKVMLGKNELQPDYYGNYVVENVQESKTVTVLGIEKTKEAEIINSIESLPATLEDLNDIDKVLEITRQYNSLPDDKKAKITNIGVLEDLQKQIGDMCHSNNGITVEGAEWYVKLVAIPISTSDETYTRIYGKLGSEYILSLYDIYLWDMLADKRYNLPTDQSVVVTLPTPDMSYFKNATAIHENSLTGRIDYLSLSYSGEYIRFEANSFSPMGIIATRSSSPGRSSLLDAIDANFKMISDYASGRTSDSQINKTGYSSSQEYNDIGGNGEKEYFDDENSSGGNISETFKRRNNKVTAQGSALRLILVLILAILLTLAIWFVYKNRRKKNQSKK